MHCKYFSCNFSGFQTCSNPSCTPDVLFTPDSRVWQSDVNQVQYICQAVILTTVTCLHLTDVLSFHLAKQQYLLIKAAIFTRNRCTIDRKNIGEKFSKEDSSSQHFWCSVFSKPCTTWPSYFSYEAMKKRYYEKHIF